MAPLKKLWSGDDKSIMIADSLVRFKSGVSFSWKVIAVYVSMAAIILACGRRKPSGELIL
jgi:hypothetical protein